MSEKKDGNMKRFFVKASPELFKKLKILAIQLGDGSAERLGGKLLEDAVERAIAERDRRPAKDRR